MPEKKRVPPKRTRTTWNLQPLFGSDDDQRINKVKKEVVRKSSAFTTKWRDRTDYLNKPSVMKEALDEYEEWKRTCGTDGDAGYYFWLRCQQDQNDPELKASFNKIEELSRKIENEMQFFILRIAKIPPAGQRKFLESEALSNYRHFLERIFAESKYLLSEPEEKILNLKAPTSSHNWIKMTSGFIAKEERKVLLEDGRKAALTFSGISSLMNSRVRKVRDSAAAAFNDIMIRHADVAEAEMNSVLANKKTDDELRKIPRPDLSRHISDDVDSEIVDALVDTVYGRFDIPRRYYKLKARLMGIKKLRYHERNVEFGKIEITYSYGKAAKLIHKVLKDLDSEFADIYSSFIDKGQIDVYPRKGKQNGAFCVHHLISQPTYILLNHTGRLHDVMTMAHEVGHGINNELIRKKHNALNFGTPTSTAEVASTFMEDFVLKDILAHSDDEVRLSLMMMKLNDDISTIFRQVACYRFERELHRAFREKGYLSKDDIGRLFQEHMASYMGESVEQSPGSENWWVYWSHIRYFFYVYSYASGLLISKSLQHSVAENAGFILNVKEFLSAGLSDSPKNIFLRLGIDISDRKFWERGLAEVGDLLDKTSTLAKKMGKFKRR
jgi:oligoendopeptidase F